MASEEEAARAAWEGADPERTLAGEDANTGSLAEARHWFGIYATLADLEQEMFDVLATFIAKMSPAARTEAEETNLPVIESQLKRFTYRRDFWRRRMRELGEAPAETDQT